MTDWTAQVEAALDEGPCVLVTLNRLAGSAPRESGARMVVGARTRRGSIGGGNLEYTAMHRARELLSESEAPRQLHEPYGLGPAMQQCCGGAVTVLYEVLSGDCPEWIRGVRASRDSGEAAVLAQAVDGVPRRSVVGFRGRGDPPVPDPVRQGARAILEGASEPTADGALPSLENDGITWWLERLAPASSPVLLFGAGHVGTEVARLLARLPFRLRWIDSRTDAFDRPAPDGVETVVTDDPVAEVAAAPPGAVFIVMTHSHPLDEDVCHAVLNREDFAWLGLIGSESKRKRFVHRLARRGVEAERLERLVCPVGIGGIGGKQPATIALSLAAQLMMEKPWIPADN